jgi:hypothetical protein
MRLINSRFANEAKFFWDERAATLEAQVTSPIQDHAEKHKPRHLLYVRIPFADDIQNLTMNPLCNTVNAEATKVCDEFIDAFALPQHALNPALTPNPGIQAFRKMMIQRALHPQSTTLADTNYRNIDNVEDPFTTPENISENQKKILKRFRATFPLEIVQNISNGQKQKRKYFLTDSQD